jgi:hypothetical protein
VSPPPRRRISPAAREMSVSDPDGNRVTFGEIGAR